MKKIIAICALVVTVATLFAGCIKSFKCDLCGEEKFGICNTKTVFGTEIEYCNECKDQLS